MIEEMWKKFAKAIFGRTPVDKVQHDEMRKAFYGGAAAMLHCVQATGDDEFTEEMGVQLLDDLQEECIAFLEEMKAAARRGNFRVLPRKRSEPGLLG